MATKNSPLWRPDFSMLWVKLKQTFHLILLCFHHKKCAKLHKQSQLPPNLYQLLSVTFSNYQIWCITPYYRLLIIRRKKSNFCGISGDRFAEIFRANFANKQSVKNGHFCGNFLGKFCLRSIDFMLIWRVTLMFFNRDNHSLF